MAQKRMFSLSVVDTDNFLEMPISSRLLYYELGMRADDDGFVANWKKILAFTNLNMDDLRVLIAKKFIIPFESGIIVIRHWRMNNYLQNDRKKDTNYQDELNELEISKNGVYSLKENVENKGFEKICIQNGNKMYTQYSIDKNSIDKNSIDKNSINTIVHSANRRERFEALWSLYPRKEGKAGAFKKYEKICNKVDDETIKQGIERYIQYINNNNIESQYVKMGSTWFNNESWNDEYINKTKKGTDAFTELWEEIKNEEERNIINAKFTESSIS